MYLLHKTGFKHFVLSFLCTFSLLILRSNWDFQETEFKDYERNLDYVVNHVIFFAITFNMGTYFILK